MPSLEAAGATLAVIGWGYLVWMAIDFGRSAKAGDSARWVLLVVAAVGAIACLFTAVMLIARLLRSLGVISPAAPTPHSALDHEDAPHDPATPPPPGGRRRS